MKLILAAALLTSGVIDPGSLAIARGGYHSPAVHEVADQPCGWRGGAMADPADTQRCLAERFKAAKPKPPKPTPGPSGPPTNSSTNAG